MRNENVKIHDATAPKSQDRLKPLLSGGSTGDIVVSKALSLNLNFSFLNRFRYFSYRVATHCPYEFGWTPFQTLYFKNNF